MKNSLPEIVRRKIADCLVDEKANIGEFLSWFRDLGYDSKLKRDAIKYVKEKLQFLEERLKQDEKNGKAFDNAFDAIDYPCGACDGSGSAGDGYSCHVCGGSGRG